MNKVALEERVTEIVTTYDAPNSFSQTIRTRFGEITFDKRALIRFPQGILGIPQEKEFYLVSYPDPEVQSYSLLQSGNNQSLCFLVVPLAPEFYNSETSLIAKSDLESAKEQYNFDKCVVLLIATIHNNKKQKISKVSVNLKAPLIIDSNKFLGYQHVLLKKDYPIKYYLD